MVERQFRGLHMLNANAQDYPRRLELTIIPIFRMRLYTRLLLDLTMLEMKPHMNLMS
jgi:hypothetical protein